MANLKERLEEMKTELEWQRTGNWLVLALKMTSRVLGHESQALSYGQRLSLLMEGAFQIEVIYWDENGIDGLCYLLSEPDRLKEFLFNEGKNHFETVFQHSKVVSADFDLTPMHGKVIYKVALDE